MSRVSYGLWKQIHNIVKDHEADIKAWTMKAEVWKSLDTTLHFL